MSEKTLTSFPAEGLDFGKTYAREKWGGRSSVSFNKEEQKFQSHSTVTGKSFHYNPTDEDLSAQDWYEVVEQNEASVADAVEQSPEVAHEGIEDNTDEWFDQPSSNVNVDEPKAGGGENENS